jgi:hypothetical protein
MEVSLRVFQYRVQEEIRFLGHLGQATGMEEQTEDCTSQMRGGFNWGVCVSQLSYRFELTVDFRCLLFFHLTRLENSNSLHLLYP